MVAQLFSPFGLLAEAQPLIPISEKNNDLRQICYCDMNYSGARVSLFIFFLFYIASSCSDIRHESIRAARRFALLTTNHGRRVRVSLETTFFSNLNGNSLLSQEYDSAGKNVKGKGKTRLGSAFLILCRRNSEALAFTDPIDTRLGKT